MTWTCAVCNITLGDVESMCPCCGGSKPADRPAGLSEEERGTIRMLNAELEALGKTERHTEEWWPHYGCAEHRKAHVASYRAARAPLEAEKQRLEARVRELEVWKESSTQQRLKWDAVCRLADKLPRALGREYQEIITEVLEAQLAQAQKPATPAGLPEVGTAVEVNDSMFWEKDTVSGPIGRWNGPPRPRAGSHPPDRAPSPAGVLTGRVGRRTTGKQGGKI